MDQINGIAILIGITGALVLLFRDWRVTFSALLLNYLFVALFVTQKAFIEPDITLGVLSISTTVLIKLITGISATAILTITAIMFTQEYTEDLDEFSLSELRRATRSAQRQSADNPRRLSDYVVPFWSLVLALLASLLLPRLYPIGETIVIDFVWYWLGLIGLFTLVTANDLLKIGLGLLLCVSSIDVLYTAIASSVQVFPIAILSLMTIVLALAIAYLCSLLYGRLKTLELAELYQQR